MRVVHAARGVDHTTAEHTPEDEQRNLGRTNLSRNWTVPADLVSADAVAVDDTVLYWSTNGDSTGVTARNSVSGVERLHYRITTGRVGALAVSGDLAVLVVGNVAVLLDVATGRDLGHVALPSDYSYLVRFGCGPTTITRFLRADPCATITVPDTQEFQCGLGCDLASVVSDDDGIVIAQHLNGRTDIVSLHITGGSEQLRWRRSYPSLIRLTPHREHHRRRLRSLSPLSRLPTRRPLQRRQPRRVLVLGAGAFRKCSSKSLHPTTT